MSKRWSTPVILAITLLGAGLRFYQLGENSFWDGEIFTLLHARKDLPELIASLRDFGAHPLLWFLVSKLFIAWDWNETMLRFPAAAAGTLAIPAMYIAGKRAVNATVGLVGALLLALAPLAVLYSQAGRMYSAMVLLVLLSLYSLWRALEERRWRWWLAFTVFNALALYTQYLALLPIASAYLFAGLMLIAQTAREQGLRLGVEWVRAFLRRSAAMWASFGLLLALYVPWLPIMLTNFVARQTRAEIIHNTAKIRLNPRFFSGLFYDLSGGEWLLVVLGLLCLVALAVALWRRDWKIWLAVITWFVPVFVIVALWAPRRFPTRYAIHLLPAYLLLAAVGLVFLRESMARWRRGLATAATALALGLVALIASLNATELVDQFHGSQTIFRGETSSDLLLRAHWRELAQLLEREVAPGDFIVYGGKGVRRPPHFLTPYLSDEFLRRVHAPTPAAVQSVNVWWIGIQMKRGEVSVRGQSPAPLFYDFDQVQAARVQMPVKFAPVPLENPSFETDAAGVAFADGTAKHWIPDGWSPAPESAAVEFALDEKHAAAGQTALRATYRQTADTELHSREVEVSPGQLFRASVRVRNVTEGFYALSPGLYVKFFDVKGHEIAYTLEPVLLPKAEKASADGEGDWQLEVVDGAVPAGAVRARLVLVFKDYARRYHPVSWLDDVHFYLEQPAR